MQVQARSFAKDINRECVKMNGIIYLVGLVVIVMAILSLIGLR